MRANKEFNKKSARKLRKERAQRVRPFRLEVTPEASARALLMSRQRSRRSPFVYTLAFGRLGAYFAVFVQK